MKHKNPDSITIEKHTGSSFSAFGYVKRIMEQGKDVASRLGIIQIRLVGFSEAEQNAIGGLLTYVISKNSDKFTTLFPETLSEKDKVYTADHDIIAEKKSVVKTITSRENEGALILTLGGEKSTSEAIHTLPVFSILTTLGQLHAILFKQNLVTKVVIENGQPRAAFVRININNKTRGDKLIDTVLRPLANAYRPDHKDSDLYTSSRMEGGKKIWSIECEKSLYDAISAAEIGTKLSIEREF